MDFPHPVCIHSGRTPTAAAQAFGVCVGDWFARALVVGSPVGVVFRVGCWFGRTRGGRFADVFIVPGDLEFASEKRRR